MEYTQEETEFIETAFRITRKHFEKDLSIENSEDVMKAVNLWKSRLGLGPNSHGLMESVFRKNGYHKDGKTTIEAYRIQLFEKKIALEKRLNELKNKEVLQIDNYISELEAQKQKLHTVPQTVLYELTQEIEKIKKEADTKLEMLRNQEVINIQRIILDFNHNLEAKSKEIFDQAKSQLDMAKDKRLKILEAELKTEAETIHKKVSYLMTTKVHEAEADALQKEIEKIEREMLPSPDENKSIKPEIKILPMETPKESEPEISSIPKEDLNEFTVNKLKKLANEEGIDFPATIRKADLIKLIEEK